MSTSNSNKLLKLKRERGNSKSDSSNKKSQNSKTKSLKIKTISNKEKLDTDSIKSADYEADDENPEETKQENSLGQLTRNFLDYIKKKGRVNININDLVNDLGVKKRRIYDITNVLQGIGYIEKKGKNEISWKRNNQSSNTPENTNPLPNNYLNNFNKLKIEFEALKKEDMENEDKLNKYREEFSLLSKRQEFPRYGYLTFKDILNFSKSDNLDFLIIKAAKGTVINVIDEEESKKAFNKIESQMKNGKIQKNEKLLESLRNTHHIFFTSTKDEKLKIFRVQNGVLSETIKNKQKGAENINNKNICNNNIIYNNSGNNISFNEENNYIKNNIIFKDKETYGKEKILNIKDTPSKSNSFNFDQINFPNNYQIPSQYSEIPKEIKFNEKINNNLNDTATFNNTNNKQFFTFSNEHQNINNNYKNFLFNFNLNKNVNNNEKNEDLSEKKNNYIGISSIFKKN